MDKFLSKFDVSKLPSKAELKKRQQDAAREALEKEMEEGEEIADMDFENQFDYLWRVLMESGYPYEFPAKLLPFYENKYARIYLMNRLEDALESTGLEIRRVNDVDGDRIHIVGPFVNSNDRENEDRKTLSVVRLSEDSELLLEVNTNFVLFLEHDDSVSIYGVKTEDGYRDLNEAEKLRAKELKMNILDISQMPTYVYILYEYCESNDGDPVEIIMHKTYKNRDVAVNVLNEMINRKFTEYRGCYIDQCDDNDREYAKQITDPGSSFWRVFVAKKVRLVS